MDSTDSLSLSESVCARDLCGLDSATTPFSASPVLHAFCRGPRSGPMPAVISENDLRSDGAGDNCRLVHDGDDSTGRVLFLASAIAAAITFLLRPRSDLFSARSVLSRLNGM